MAVKRKICEILAPFELEARTQVPTKERRLLDGRTCRRHNKLLRRTRARTLKMMVERLPEELNLEILSWVARMTQPRLHVEGPTCMRDAAIRSLGRKPAAQQLYPLMEIALVENSIFTFDPAVWEMEQECDKAPKNPADDHVASTRPNALKTLQLVKHIDLSYLVWIRPEEDRICLPTPTFNEGQATLVAQLSRFPRLKSVHMLLAVENPGHPEYVHHLAPKYHQALQQLSTLLLALRSMNKAPRATFRINRRLMDQLPEYMEDPMVESLENVMIGLDANFLFELSARRG